MILHKLGIITKKTFDKNIDYYLDLYNIKASEKNQSLVIIKEKNKIIFYGEIKNEKIHQ